MHLPAAELLLKQFLKASDDIISKISPQENFLHLLNDPRFARALGSLRLLVQHHLSLLLKHLEGWRASTHNGLMRLPDKTDRDRVVVTSKRAAMEVIYFEAALQLLDLYTDDFLENKEFIAYYDMLQKNVFRVLLIAEDVFPFDYSKVVVAEAARVVGAISRKIALSHVVEPFVAALTDRINPKKDPSGAKTNYDALRAQIVRLSSGMRHVSLSFSSQEAVQEAVSFLVRVHPLNHTAPIKKSQIHHALADMLTSILLPLVRSDAPQKAAALLGPSALEQWYQTVMSIRADIVGWMNKHQKHVNDGYPLATTLLCLASDKDYSAHVDTAADFLHKGLKVKENRAVCVRCLVVLACSYLVRYGAHIIKHELHKWLDRVLKPVTQLAKKGGLTISEQLEVIAPIAELSPEFALQYLILELLNSDVNDCALAGLRAVQALILTAPAVAAAAAAGSGHHRSASSLAQGGPGAASASGYGSAHYNGNGSSGGALPSSSSTSGLQAIPGASACRRHTLPNPFLGAVPILRCAMAYRLTIGCNPAAQALLRRAPTPSAGGLLYSSPSLAAGGLVSSASVGSGLAGGGGGSGPGGGSSGSSGVVPAAAFAAVNDMLRRGLHPLEVLGVSHLLTRISAALAKLLTSLHAMYGSNLLYGPGDPNWKEKAAGFPVLLTLIRLLPYLKPDVWANSRPLDVLPSYTCHAEASLRVVAEEVLLSVVRGCPHLRNTVICSFAAFTAALPDDAVQCVRDSQRLLRDLMELWIALLAERAGGDAVEVVSGGTSVSSGGPISGREALAVDVHRLEGYSLVCMASHDEAIRREAMQSLHLIRALHQATLSAEPYELPPCQLKPGLGGAMVTRNHSSGGLTVTGPSGATSSNFTGVVSRPVHGPSASRESLDIYGGVMDLGPGTPGPAKSNTAQGLPDALEADPPTYLVELVEESGPALLRETYWDFGDFSDMWRLYKPVPENVTFEEVLAAPGRPSDELSRVRLARALLALMALAVRLVPASAAVAAVELVARLGRMLGRGGDNRLVLLAEYLEPGRRDAWRNCSAMICACPHTLRERTQEKLARRLPSLTSRDIIRMHLALLTACASSSSSSAQAVPPSLQLCSMMSLGHLSSDMYGILMEEMQPYIDDYLGGRGAGSGKSKSKMRDELRRCMAHVFRILSEQVPLEVLNSNPQLRSRVLEFIRESYTVLRNIQLGADTFWEAVQVAYCLTAVVRNIAVSLRPLLSQALHGGPITAAQQLQRDSQGRAPDAAMAATAAASGGGASLRKLLWELILFWCEEAYILLKDLKAVVGAVAPGSDVTAALRTCPESNYTRAINLGIGAVLHKLKDSPEGLREELHLASHYVNHSARLALAALLEGPVFDNDTRRPTGPVFTWIDKLLAVPREGPGPVTGPPRRTVGFKALRALLTHNPDLFEACLDKCYDSNCSLASGYFQVMCEVYGTQPVRCEPHIVLALVLVKIVDPAQEVREDALHMLNVLSQREWQSGASAAAQGLGLGLGLGADPGSSQAAAGASPSSRNGAPGSPNGADAEVGAAAVSSSSGVGVSDDGAVLVIGSLQDSYNQFQYELSGSLAREHPELSEALCEEMMTRQLECNDGLIQHPVLTSLAPWMENLIISFPWRGNWSERLLKSMYYVTLRHGTQFPSEIQRLWTQLAKRTRNINPILDFLLHLGMATALQTEQTSQQTEHNLMMDFFSVAKRIVLYLARVSPTETIGYLAIELAKQQMEEGDAMVEGAYLTADGAGTAATSAAAPAGVGASRGTAASGAKVAASGAPVAFPHVLVFGGPLDCVVAGEERTMYTSYESVPTVSSTSQGGAASTSGLGLSSHLEPASSATGAGGGSYRNQSLDQGPRPLSGRSEASGSSRSDANGLGGGGGGMGSLADSSTAPGRGLLGGLGFGGSDHRLRPADDSRSAGGLLGNKALLSRAELVLCCLAEVVYEHEVDPQHLPLLLHVALTCADHGEAVVSTHCQQLIVNLLYSRSAQMIDLSPDLATTPRAVSTAGYAGAATNGGAAATTDAAPPSFAAASPDAVAAAASLDGNLLPSAAALGGLTVAVTEALSYEPSLAVEWGTRALDWAQHARSRHAACRSWQVLRALRPPLKADLAAALVLSLEACFQSGLMAGCEVAVEIITTTRLLVESLPPGRLVLYPQIWWAALALLHSPHVAVYRAALGLLGACVGSGAGGVLRLWASKVQAVLLAAAPGLSAAQLLAASHAATTQDSGEDADGGDGGGTDVCVFADPWVLGYHVLNVREASPQSTSPHGSIAVQQLLLRGLTHPLTVAPTLHLLAAFGEALAQQAQVLLARTGPSALHQTQSGHQQAAYHHNHHNHHNHQHPQHQHYQHYQPLQQPHLLMGGSSASSSAGGGAEGPGYADHLGLQLQLPRLTSGLDGDAMDDSLLDGAGGATRTGSGVGVGLSRGAIVVPHSDSLRKHRALKLDSFQTLLGSCRSQLFVSLMGLLPLMLSLHGNAGGSGIVASAAGGGGSAASSSEDFPQLQPQQHSRAARCVAAAAAAAASQGVAGGAGVNGGVGVGGADAVELAEAIQRAVAALGRAAVVLGMGPELGAHLQVLSSQQLSFEPELLESTVIQLLTLLSRALFPRYTSWVLHHLTDLLVGGTAATWASAAAGSSATTSSATSFAAAAAAAAAASGGCMPPGPRQDLRLGPAAALLVADGALLQPVVALTTGPMGALATETLAAALQYSQDERFQRDLQEAAARASQYEQQQLSQPQPQPAAPRTLFPPVTPVGERVAGAGASGSGGGAQAEPPADTSGRWRAEYVRLRLALSELERTDGEDRGPCTLGICVLFSGSDSLTMWQRPALIRSARGQVASLEAAQTINREVWLPESDELKSGFRMLVCAEEKKLCTKIEAAGMDYYSLEWVMEHLHGRKKEQQQAIRDKRATKQHLDRLWEQLRVWCTQRASVLPFGRHYRSGPRRSLCFS
ncbi:hypothetical protein VOLCADRAFT_117341 [Volvox carteri f. nagariensis]|uniref:Uncharacterized protein n=1 Tax=Volvox carteri f. nagariensis TaxID=3068 RepID=D8TTH8_VOLCA|nr:uncharacterized protein VOLCADRAFT_117341 [Volvox carteri f. nagariensis]EFJ49201.1 hypothetical protein VOLCADRAFT_117341 [Volvox carteri f. nagariensis]|eukprot:XP_002949649.1 hypothetical protein VOLCADRAFT_117341 [Volvox carteri f. nagariensis]